MEYEFDLDKFIYQVESHELLWNASIPEYVDRLKKNLAWMKIAGVMFDDFENMNLKNKEKRVKLLKLKWFNLKNSYIRGLRLSRAEKGDANTKRIGFHHFDQLKFLQAITNQELLESSFCDSSAEENLKYKPVYLNPTMEEEPIREALSIKKQPSQMLPITEVQSIHKNPTLKEKLSVEGGIWKNSITEEDLTQKDSTAAGFLQRNAAAEKESSVDDNVPNLQNEKPPITETGKRINPFEKELLTILKKNVKRKKDSDSLFLESLYDDFKRVLPQNKMKVKMELIHCIQSGLITENSFLSQSAQSSSHQISNHPQTYEMLGEYAPIS